MIRFTIKTIANLLLLAHFAWVVLLVGGTIYIFYNPGYIQAHLTIITLTLLLNLFLGYCPLTVWEQKARKMVDPQFDYGDSFAATYLRKLFGVDLSPNSILILMTIIKIISYFAAVGIAIYR